MRSMAGDKAKGLQISLLRQARGRRGENPKSGSLKRRTANKLCAQSRIQLWRASTIATPDTHELLNVNFAVTRAGKSTTTHLCFAGVMYFQFPLKLLQACSDIASASPSRAMKQPGNFKVLRMRHSKSSDSSLSLSPNKSAVPLLPL